jgi:predicted metal-dependent hydrolase
MNDAPPPPYPDAYLEGVQLFNAGRYYEAHEALEQVWRACPKESRERLFYQALIQIAAACLHRARGRWRPALLQYHRAIEKLDRVATTELLGMDLAGLRADIHATFAPLTADPQPPLPDPAPWLVALPPAGGG